MNEPVAQCFHQGLGAVLNLEFGQEAADVDLDGDLSDSESGSDFLVTAAVGELF